MSNIAILRLEILKAKITKKPKIYIQKLQQELDKAVKKKQDNKLNKN